MQLLTSWFQALIPLISAIGTVITLTLGCFELAERLARRKQKQKH